MSCAFTWKSRHPRRPRTAEAAYRGGAGPYRAEMVSLVPMLALSRVQPGCVITVRCDPQDPRKMAFESANPPGQAPAMPAGYGGQMPAAGYAAQAPMGGHGAQAPNHGQYGQPHAPAMPGAPPPGHGGHGPGPHGGHGPGPHGGQGGWNVR